MYEELSGSELQQLVSWLEKADIRFEEIRRTIQAHVQQELNKRRLELGGGHPRTEQCHLLSGFIQYNELTSETHDGETNEASGLCSPVPQSELPAIIRTFDNITVAPLPRQLRMLFQLAMCKRLLKNVPDSLDVLFQLILSKATRLPTIILWGIGNFYVAMDELDKALTIFEMTLKMVETKETPLKYEIYYRIGDLYYCRGMYVLGLEHFQRARAGRENLLGQRHLDTLYCIFHIGRCYHRLADYRRSLMSFQQASTGFTRILGYQHRSTLNTYTWIGHSHYELEDYQLALDSYHLALAGYQRLTDREWSVSDTHFWVGISYFRLRDYQHSLEAFEQALIVKIRLRGYKNVTTLLTHHWVGRCHVRLGNYQLALESWQRLLTAQKTLYGYEHADTLKTESWIGICQFKLGNYQLALQVWQ